MAEKICKNCWFYRAPGYLSAGLNQKPTKVDTCGLENIPLKSLGGCKKNDLEEHWMSNSGTMINVEISEEAQAEAKKAGKKRWEKERK